MDGRITEAELLEEVRRWASAVEEREPGTITGPEIGEAINRSHKTYLPMIKRWIAAGKLEPCRVKTVDLVGRQTTTFGYRILS
jgi:hypothetical protein